MQKLSLIDLSTNKLVLIVLTVPEYRSFQGKMPSFGAHPSSFKQWHIHFVKKARTFIQYSKQCHCFPQFLWANASSWACVCKIRNFRISNRQTVHIKMNSFTRQSTVPSRIEFPPFFFLYCLFESRFKLRPGMNTTCFIGGVRPGKFASWSIYKEKVIQIQTFNT